MRKIIYILISFAGLLSFTSCEKFLEVTPQNEKIVSTAEDYRDIMASFMKYIKTPNPEATTLFGTGSFIHPIFDVSSQLAIYTDEAGLSRTSGTYFDKELGAYTNTGKNLLTWLNTNLGIWERYYEFLGHINHIALNIPEADGNEDVRNYVHGEALLWRAYSYFKLLQYFSPYGNNDLGVPIYLDPTDNLGYAMPPRETQETVFKQILDDCHKALELLKTTRTNQWNLLYREDFIYSMMASIYTWKAESGAKEDSDWQNAYDYATLAVGGRMLATNTETLKAIFDCSAAGLEANLSNNSEMTVRIADGDNGYIFAFRRTSGFFASGTYYYDSYVDADAVARFKSRYKDNDIRRDVYFNAGSGKFDKYNIASSGGGTIVFFRLAEMVLIQAEAMVRLGNESKALEHLYAFRSSRYAGYVEEKPDNILYDILEERRLEFYFELDYRWLDMKRNGVTIERTVSGEVHTLKGDDFRYTFPIPAREMQYNKNMVQSPGWEGVLLV